MLPHFPKSHQRIEQLWLAALVAGHKEASPFLAQIPVRTQKEGIKHRVGEDDSDYQLCAVETRLDIRDAEGLSVSEFYEIF